MSFKIENIIDANKVQVKPKWIWNEQNGDVVLINGIDSPVKDDEREKMKKKLGEVLLGKEVDLVNPERITGGILLCQVKLNDTDVKDSLK